MSIDKEYLLCPFSLARGFLPFIVRPAIQLGISNRKLGFPDTLSFRWTLRVQFSAILLDELLCGESFDGMIRLPNAIAAGMVNKHRRDGMILVPTGHWRVYGVYYNEVDRVRPSFDGSTF